VERVSILLSIVLVAALVFIVCALAFIVVTRVFPEALSKAGKDAAKEADPVPADAVQKAG
jgi:hypothetical protein